MRASYWLIAGVLIAVAAVFVFWPSSVYRQSVPPGQYPLDAWRPEWTATKSVGLYRPRSAAGQDTLAPSGYRDAKMQIISKSCTLPIVAVRAHVPVRPTHLYA